MITLIAALAQNYVIGADNKLLWHISEDLKRFKLLTTGHPVIMGRKTYESLGRPLPNRPNVVITRDEDFAAAGVIIVNSPQAALELFPDNEEIFIIGGGKIYADMLPLADRMYLTMIGHDYQGDTYFPRFDESEWTVTFKEYHPRGENYPYPFTYLDYVRKK